MRAERVRRCQPASALETYMPAGARTQGRARTDSEYTAAALRLGMSRSAAMSSKNVGRAASVPPSATKDMLLLGGGPPPQLPVHPLHGTPATSPRICQ